MKHPGDDAAKRAREADKRYDRIANPLESQILQEVFSALVHSGHIICWRNNSGVATVRGSRIRFGLGVGSADIVGVMRGSGRFVGFEVKAALGRVSAEQQAWHRVVNEAGGRVYVVRSADEALVALKDAQR